MNWIALLEAENVPYVTRGKNTKRGEISIHCPWCGDDDPSEHLGISLTADNWGCHRNAEHRGHSPIRLIRAIIGCSAYQAGMLVQQYSTLDPDAPLMAPAAPPSAPQRALRLPSEFRPINPMGTTARFWRYLEARGFDDVSRLVDEYGLLCAQTGTQKDRVIIPIYQGGELIGWTGRALSNPINAPRYLSSSEAIKRTVFNEDLLTGGRVLFITEGPFDALKLDFYGSAYGAHATCLFGATLTLPQASILNVIIKRYRKVILLLDHDAIAQTFAIAEWLLTPNVTIGQLPRGVKDPGDLNHAQIKELLTD